MLFHVDPDSFSCMLYGSFLQGKRSDSAPGSRLLSLQLGRYFFGFERISRLVLLVGLGPRHTQDGHLRSMRLICREAVQARMQRTCIEKPIICILLTVSCIKRADMHTTQMSSESCKKLSFARP